MAAVETLVPADYPGCPATVLSAQEAGRDVVAPRWGLWDVFIMCTGALLAAFVASLILDFVDAPFAVQTFGVLISPWIFFAGWPLLVTRIRGNGPVIDLGLRLTWRDAGIGVAAGVVVLIAGAVVSVISLAIFGDFNSAAGSVAVELVEGTDRGTWLLFAVALSVCGPIVEELAFRGMAFAALRKRGLPVWATVVLSAALFALFHFEPIRLPVLLVVGVILGVVRARTGVLGPSMVAHAINNLPGAVLVVMGLPGVTP